MGKLNKDEFDDLNVIIKNTLNSLIECADNHNIDKNDFIRYFSSVFGTMAQISTFENYKKG